MRAVHQALGCVAGKYPRELGDFRNIGLAVEDHAIGVKATGEPGGSDLAGGAVDHVRVLAFDQRMKIGEEEKRLHVVAATCLDSRAEHAHIVAEVRRAAGGDAGKDTLVFHGFGDRGLKLRMIRSRRDAGQPQQPHHTPGRHR